MRPSASARRQTPGGPGTGPRTDTPTARRSALPRWRRTAAPRAPGRAARRPRRALRAPPAPGIAPVARRRGDPAATRSWRRNDDIPETDVHFRHEPFPHVWIVL